MSKKKPVAPPPDPRQFLERHLRTGRDEGAVALDRHAYDTLVSEAVRMRELAWEIREGQRVFGATSLSSHAVRRLEWSATKLERNLLTMLQGIERWRETLAERKVEVEKRLAHRKYMRDWRQKKKIEAAEAKAAAYEPDDDCT